MKSWTVWIGFKIHIKKNKNYQFRGVQPNDSYFLPNMDVILLFIDYWLIHEKNNFFSTTAGTSSRLRCEKREMKTKKKKKRLTKRENNIANEWIKIASHHFDVSNFSFSLYRYVTTVDRWSLPQSS